MPIKRDTALDLLKTYLQIVHSRGAPIPAQALREQIGDRLHVLLSLGVVHKGRPLSHIVCRNCFEGHTALVEYDEDTCSSWIFCSEAGRVFVGDELLETVQPNSQWLPDQLAAALNVRASPPRRTLIEGAAWWLGDIRVGQTEVSIAAAVGLRSSAEYQQLIESLQGRPPLALGLVLSAGVPLPAYVGHLTQYYPIAIEDVVRAEGETLNIDRLRLEAWSRSLLRGSGSPSTRHQGRPSNGEQIVILFNSRRQRGEPYPSKLSEARAIRAEWLSHFPDTDPPALTTIRNHLPGTTSF